MPAKPCIVGIDFGTTSLSAVVINTNDVKIEKVLCYNTNAYLALPDVNRKEQSVDVLTKLFGKLLEEVNAIQNIQILAYGFTGQMHGIVGLNKQNEAVTNLVTWQDQSGEIVLENNTKLLDKVKQLTKTNTLASGYGTVTLYKWLVHYKRTDINSFCTIADYFARQLTSNNKPNAMSPSMAHSIGLFDIYANNWDYSSINTLGLGAVTFPNITDNSFIVGYINGAPVINAIGDNQASFLSSVINKQESILLNVGTGTQLSFLINKNEVGVYTKYIDGFETQLRPFDNDSYLVSTSFLNGGSVYNSLFSFFKEIGSSLLGVENINDDSLWQKMQELGEKSMDKKNALTISPILEGERKNPELRGSISNINTANFHPEDFITGFLTGLAKHYQTGYFPELKNKIRYICGSGNGLKKNALFSRIIEETFGHPLQLTPYNEEAAIGAAVNAAQAIKLIDDKESKTNFLNKLAQNSI